MPAGRLQSVVSDYRAQLVSHEASAEQTLAQSYIQTLQVLQPRLNALYKQIDDAYASGMIQLPLNWLYEAKRLQTIEDYITSQFTHFGTLSQTVTQQLQQTGVSLGTQGALALLNAHVPPNMSVSFGFPSAGAITSLVGATQKGSPLSDLFSGFGTEAAQNVRQALLTGLSLGQSVQEVARGVQNALNIERSRSLTTARTELLRSYRSANLETYKANDDLVSQWRWTATKSTRTCAACLAMDGTLHDLSEDMGSHPCCRCCPTPVLKAEWAQVDYQSGEDWLNEQDTSVQQQILGNKYDGWNNGDFSLSDIVGKSHDKDWGSSIYLKSLKQLQAA